MTERHSTYIGAFDSLVRATLQLLATERTPRGDRYEARRIAAENHLALAARDLTRATDELPEDQQPPGWGSDAGQVTRRLPAYPDADGVVRVRHGLGSEDVRVRCEDSHGLGIGYLNMVVISPDEVEVLIVPGSAVAYIEVSGPAPVAA